MNSVSSMNSMSYYTSAAGAIFKRDLLIFLSYRFRVITQVGSTVFSLVMFYYVSRLVHFGTFRTSNQYFAYVVVGIAILGVLLSGFATAAGTMRQELVAGTFERLVVSPAGATGCLVSTMIFPFIQGIVTASVTLMMGALVFGMPLNVTNVPAALGVALLGALAFAPFGVIVAAAVAVVKEAASVTNYIIAVLSILAGFYFPVTLLPSWIRWTANVQPFTPAVDLMRHLLINTPTRQPVAIELLKLGGFAAVLIPISIYLLAGGLRVAQRRGTIIEY